MIRLAALVLLVALVACGPGVKRGPVRIEGNDKLRCFPDAVTVSSGKHRFTFANVGGLSHELRIVGVYSSGVVTGNRSVSFDTTLKPGTYEFVCRVDNHDQAGMRGKLVVR